MLNLLACVCVSTTIKTYCCLQTKLTADSSLFVFDRFSAFHAESKKPLHRECGFIRMQPGTNRVAFIIAQNSGSYIQVTGGTLVFIHQAPARISGIGCSFERVVPDVQRPGMSRVFWGNVNIWNVFTMYFADVCILDQGRNANIFQRNMMQKLKYLARTSLCWFCLTLAVLSCAF